MAVVEGRHVFPQLSVLENLKMGAYRRNDYRSLKDIDGVFDFFVARRRTK